jgi:GTPase SAR1 family protein
MGDKENSGGENITRAEAKATTAQQPADLLANFKSVAAASAAQLVGVLKEQGSMAGVRADKEVLYATIEDFARVDPNARRVVVIGCTGSGKSTMLNTMAGWKFVQRAPDYKYTWERGDADGTPLFEARASSDSVTKKTTYANLEWFGDASRPFVAVDTPGHDDPAGSEIDSPEAREVLGELAADLHNKLKALRHVHAIVVLHNDILSNRLNPATYTILKMVSEKFAKAETSVWKNVVVAYSKCNAHETSWRSELASKKAKMQATIREKLASCDIDVPVLALGGGTIDPKPPSAEMTDDFEQLWEFVCAAQPLDTTRIQPFEGADVKWQKIIDAKESAEAQAKAALIYFVVMLKVALLVISLFWRHFLVPKWLAVLMLNFTGVYDELIIVFLFVKWVGPSDVYYSALHSYKMWLEPKVGVYVDQLHAAAAPYLSQITSKAKPKAE